MPPITNAQAVCANALSATGSTAPVTVGPVSTTPTGQALTLELWVTAAAAGTGQTLATVSGDGQTILKVALTTGTAASVTVQAGPGPGDVVTSPPLDVQSGWHLISVSWGAKGVTLWIDAEPAGTGTTPVPVSGPLDVTVQLGAQRVREVRLWSEALTETTVDANMFECEAPQAGLVVLADLATIPAHDRAGGHVPVVLASGVVYELDAMACEFPGDSCVDCQGPADLVFSGTDSYTLETWVRPAQLGALMAVAVRTDSEGRGWGILLDATGCPMATRGTDAATATTPLTVGTWAHLAAVYDGTAGTLQLFVDGAPAASVPSTASNDLAVDSSLLIGAAYGSPTVPTECLFGHVGELRVWDRARTQAEIAAFRFGHPIGAPGVRAYYGFDVAPPADLTGQQPDIELVGDAEVVAVSMLIAPDDPKLDTFRPQPAPQYTPTPDELQDELALLRAAVPSLAVSGPVDFRGLLELDQSTFAVALERDGEHLVLRDNREDGRPVLLRAVDETDDMTLWTIAVVIQSVDIFFTAVGLRLISASKATSVTLKLLRNLKFRTALAAMMAAVSVRSLIAFFVELGGSGLLWTIVWDLIDISFWSALSFVAGIFRWSTPLGFAILSAALAVSIAGLIYLIAHRPVVGAPPTETINIRMFQASFGDSILLGVTYAAGHGAPPTTRNVLVDGGPAGVYAQVQHLLPQDLHSVCCTHVDADHIVGIIDLFNAIPPQPPGPGAGRAVGQLLFNAPPARSSLEHLADQVFDEDGEVLPEVAALTEFDEDPRFELHSWQQGRNLAQIAGNKNVPIVPIQNGSPPIGYGSVTLGFTAPQAYNIQRYVQTQNPENANRESIIFVARSATYPAVSILMTGDAFDLNVPDTPPAPANTFKTDIRGNVPPVPGGLHYLFMKVPHHASARSEDAQFYAGCTADYYLVSADDVHHTLPSFTALSWIVQGNQALGRTGYSIYCTNDTPEVRRLAADPNLGPVPAGYSLFILNPGQPSLDFTIVNGVVTMTPPAPLAVTRL